MFGFDLWCIMTVFRPQRSLWEVVLALGIPILSLKLLHWWAYRDVPK